MAGRGIPREDECGHVGFAIFDSTGQPILRHDTDVCGDVPWVMGWGPGNRLWLVPEAGNVRWWELDEGEWVEHRHSPGQWPQVPVFEK